MANITARAGAMPAPAISNAPAIHQKSRMIPARAIPTNTTAIRVASAEGPMGTPPRASPPMIDPMAQIERMIPAWAPSWPKTETTATSTAAAAPINRKPTTVAKRTGGFFNTTPILFRLGGMVTVPSSRHERNQIPPAIRKTPATTMAQVVEICVAIKVVTTGPAIQMIS